jgi:hypothetical protein
VPNQVSDVLHPVANHRWPVRKGSA